MPQTRARPAAAAVTSNSTSSKQMNSTRVSTPATEKAPATTPISVSTRFNPEERDMLDADLVLVSQDQVYFYAHHSILLRESSNGFALLLPTPLDDLTTEIDVFQPMSTADFLLAPTPVTMEYSSDVLNLALHIIYGLPAQSYRPTPSTLRTTTTALFTLGYNLERVFSRHSEPYMLFLQSAVSEPLHMYALAAQYSLESLAVAVSTFTLRASLSDIADELAEQMGPVYLRRLFFLHLGRADALKRLLYPPPSSHAPSPNFKCTEKSRQEIPRIWALASASAVIENHPYDLAKTFAPLSTQVSCVGCRQMLYERVGTLMNEWNSIKNTI
ncbi:hypothetical protein FRC12_015466 [Ceratobasidium sp. 428]|nr:hypothetical protein FRC12_015466 [Ceratobasidium sp. 428]